MSDFPKTLVRGPSGFICDVKPVSHKSFCFDRVLLGDPFFSSIVLQMVRFALCFCVHDQFCKTCITNVSQFAVDA